VDKCVGRIVEKTLEKKGIAVITGDHGNAEKMLTPEGGKVTSHSNSLVPLCIVGWRKDAKLKPGKLGDVAPTLLKILDLKIPVEMTGECLLE